MKKPVVDYRQMRFRNRNDPEFAHVKLLLCWVVYFLLYFLTENLIPTDACHVIHCALDDRIPFLEWFAVFYVGWYGLIIFSLVYFLLYRIDSFKKLQTYIFLTQMMATIIYILYPSRQMLRPEAFPRENICTAIIGMIYRVDTNTCVFPSLHAAISIAIASVWCRQKGISLWIKGGIAWFCAMVCLSVCFVKQHSVLDILAAIPVCLVAEWFVFGRKAK